MFKRILVPVDGSTTSNKALTQALQLARELGARVRLLHAIDELVYINVYGYSPALMDAVRDAATKVLADALEIAKSAGVEVDTRMVDEPAQRLGATVAKEAQDWNADLVVLGTHGRRGFSRMVLGSGAEQIIREAKVPVLTIRAEEE
ncbi:universal stress protein [Caenimonas aquaedulcis]|uniref:Universal stress protein n=1 Tax=Caenimonas aquaedulcis TaxID=2793270 RepID=A0A931H882_9BURK|nr:universal stress protein [Caenimonas aquaedulcis]MBG9390222.1 universal stress protein [Caenimonas aquaedulcis]